MPISFRIDSARRLVLSTATGPINIQELSDHQRRLGADPAFDESLDQVYDLCDVTEVDVDGEAIRKLADNNPFGPGSRRAFIAATDLVFGLIRMFESRSTEDGHDLRVFRSREEAAHWLGLEGLFED